MGRWIRAELLSPSKGNPRRDSEEVLNETEGISGFECRQWLQKS